MPQLEHITAIEKRLRSAADNLRASSNYASNEYYEAPHELGETGDVLLPRLMNGEIAI